MLSGSNYEMFMLLSPTLAWEGFKKKKYRFLVLMWHIVEDEFFKTPGNFFKLQRGTCFKRKIP